MGIGGISIWQLLIILVIVIMLFGTKRLRGLGGDLGGAIKGFKKALNEEPAADDKPAPQVDDKTDTKVDLDAKSEGVKSGGDKS